MAKDRAGNSIGTREPELDWSVIDWQTVERRVRTLRQRIYRATGKGQWNQVRSLMKLMLRSFSNLLLSVKKVTQENHGKDTAGVDRQLVLTPQARARLVQTMLEYKTWEVKPAKRVYIPKANGKQRPLGILTIKNRVAQAVVKNALEPSWESRFETNSYGFRPGRGCHDAIEQCWRRLNRHCKDRWVLDADVKAAFDNMSHEHIMQKLGNTPGRELIRQWLKAGYVENEIFHATTAGVPQGGVISPLLANIALDGMQELIGSRAGFIRYADDFVLTARSREELERLRPALEKWLSERGLAMNEEKTEIKPITEGFNFLGFNIRHYRGVCLVRPEKGKVLDFLQRIRDWLKEHRQVEAAVVVRYLNAILRGWSNYYRHAASKQTFDYVKHQIWIAIWRWCRRRHPNKGVKWTKRKYFTHYRGRDWTFFAKDFDAQGLPTESYLYDVSQTPIRRHIKVRAEASPDNPLLRDYWAHRHVNKRRSDASCMHDATFTRLLLEA